MLSAYEEQRARNIMENAIHLAALGLKPLVGKKQPTPRQHAGKRKERGEQEPKRRSLRAQQLPVSVYTPDDKDADSTIAEDTENQIANGYRLPKYPMLPPVLLRS